MDTASPVATATNEAPRLAVGELSTGSTAGSELLSDEVGATPPTVDDVHASTAIVDVCHIIIIIIIFIRLKTQNKHKHTRKQRQAAREAQEPINAGRPYN